MLKHEAIKAHLIANTEPDLAALYSLEMEVQVNAAADNGKKVIVPASEGKRGWWGWCAEADLDGKLPRRGAEVWKHIRIPWNAKVNPEYVDSEMRFATSHFEGIGCTGWNWAQKKSIWVGFDFDSIVGHKKGLSDTELREIQTAVQSCPWVTVRRSTSGAGLHFYVFFADPPATANHEEHAALARSVLGLLSAAVGHRLEAKVDTCGGILWFWHRRKKENGFKLIKQGVPLDQLPSNWKDHIAVIQRKAVRIPFYGDQSVDNIMIKTKFAPLTDSHKRLLGWFEQHKEKVMWWWDNDRHMLVCHTSDLKAAHKELNLVGIFETLATGKEQGVDQNAFCFPLPVGWAVRRHHKGTNEHKVWEVDSTGWTRCYYDRPADLGSACRAFDGSENKDGEFIFRSFDGALKALDHMGVKFEAPNELSGRPTIIRELRDGRLVIGVERKKDDGWIASWAPEKNEWQKVVKPPGLNKELETPDENVRHLVSAGENAGWYFRSREEWIDEDKANILLALAALGNSRQDITVLMGNSVLNYWTLACEPFQPEYPGDRRWNKNAPQLAYIPKPGNHPTWDAIFEHLGRGLQEAVELNDWCKKHSVVTGADYLRLWVASLFQFPKEPLPYLFFYSTTQNTGKTTFHEALALLMRDKKGVVRADAALTSDGRYNGELLGAVLCVVEETDLKKQKEAYERIKDWVTSKTILIHTKGVTPFDAPNYTHWVHCANNRTNCPVLPGDTRIVVCRVGTLEKEIPKEKLLAALHEEAPYFLDTILSLEIPEPDGRLRIPVISTYEKQEQQDINRDPVTLFMLKLTQRDGYAESIEDLYAAFLKVMPEEHHKYWTQRRFASELPDWCVTGRYRKGGLVHVGNISLQPPENVMVPLPKLVRRDGKLMTADAAMQADTEKALA